MGNGQRRVVWTPSARDCLDAILEYIADVAPEATEKVLDGILNTAASLDVYATRGRVVPELRDEAIREVFAFRYRIIYRVASNEVQLLAVIHGAMDYHFHM